MAFFGRIFLALCVAFVFTGRMEAAASHCAKLAAESMADAQPAEPCHDAAGQDTGSQDMAGHHMAKPEPSRSMGDPAGPCECIAMIKAFSELPAIQLAKHEVPFRWQAPVAVAFVSVVADVEGPPPRAA